MKHYLSLPQFFQRFPDENACKDFIELARWNGEPACPRCGDTKVYRLKGTMPFKCGGCKQRFSHRTGTMMEESRLPLQKWFLAIYIMTTARKGISSVQFAKELGVTQKTAWYLEHRIREACVTGAFELRGEVEVDETYFGGKERNKHRSQRLNAGRGPVGKVPVMGMVERGGPVQAFIVLDTDKDTLQGHVQSFVKRGSTVYTDEAASYRSLGSKGYGHESVKHSAGEYVKEQASTNSVESFWSLLKRGYIGTHHWWSFKHLHRYIVEYVYRQNTRGITGELALASVIRNGENSRLTYAKLIS